MKETWKEFLLNAGAEIDDGRVEHFGNPERELQVVTSGDIITDLSHLGLIAVHGEDAERFLQNQLCSDAREVTETHSQLSAACSAKGRMLASFRLFVREGSYYLRLPLEMLDAALKHLHKYVLGSKVTLEDISDNFVRIGLSGPHAEQMLREALPQIPEHNDDAVQLKDLTVLRVPGPHPRFELIGEPDFMRTLWDRLNVHAAPVGVAAWRLLDILAGIPTIYPQTMDAFVPQMVNLQSIGALSFTKGCYPGQEVVARTQYLGKLKRRMYAAHLTGATAPQPGDVLYAPDADENQTAGKIVDAHASPDGGYDVLAVVLIHSAEGGTVRLHDARGEPLVLKELPYPLS